MPLPLAVSSNPFYYCSSKFYFKKSLCTSHMKRNLSAIYNFLCVFDFCALKVSFVKGTRERVHFILMSTGLGKHVFRVGYKRCVCWRNFFQIICFFISFLIIRTGWQDLQILYATKDKDVDFQMILQFYIGIF